jgi:threonine aldolase
MSVQPGCQFASDNTAGACPEALAALVAANEGYVPSYGDDRYTAAAADRIREIFECDCEVFFVFNGTAANSLAIAAGLAPYHSVVCADVAHIETDECGGPEFFSGGSKILLAPTVDGRLDVDGVLPLLDRRSDLHFPKPRLLSVTQPTELGTVYQVEHLARLGELARRRGLRFHMDGARFANAGAALDVAPSELTWKVGVDVLAFGGSKMGLPGGEALVFFNRELAFEFAWRCKQAGQLASKMRFIAAPWLGMLEGDAWLRHARHANEQARKLAAGLTALPSVRLASPREANGVFAELPAAVRAALRQLGWKFYAFIGAGACRFMCSWATTDQEVSQLLSDVRAAGAAHN